MPQTLLMTDNRTSRQLALTLFPQSLPTHQVNEMPSVPRTSITLRRRRNLKRSRVTTRKGKHSKVHRRPSRRPQPRERAHVEAGQRCAASEGLRNGLGLPVLPFPFPNQQTPAAPNPSVDQYPGLANPSTDSATRYAQHPHYSNLHIPEDQYAPPQAALPFVYHPTPQYANPPYLHPQVPFSSIYPAGRVPTPALSYMDDSSNMSLTPVPYEATHISPASASSGSTLVVPTPVPRMQLAEGGGPSEIQLPEPGPSHRPNLEALPRDKGKGRAIEGGFDPRAADVNAYLAVRMAAQDFYQALDAFIGMLDRI